jgi:hypothetical protein
MAELDKGSIKYPVLDWEIQLAYSYYTGGGSVINSSYTVKNEQVYGSGVKWETAITGETLKYGEFIPDKFTIEFKEEDAKILSNFIEFRRGFIIKIRCKRQNISVYNNGDMVASGLVIENVDVNKDACIIKLTAYSMNKYFDDKIYFEKIPMTDIYYQNREFGSGRMTPEHKYFPSFKDVCDNVQKEVEISINSLLRRTPYVSSDVDMRVDNFYIHKDSVTGGGLNLSPTRYYINTDKQKQEFITLKELISMLSEKFGTFVRLKCESGKKNTSDPYDTITSYISMGWFDKDYLMQSVNTLNTQGRYTRSVQKSYGGIVKKHDPCTHMVVDYFNANVDPMPQDLTASVFTCKDTFWVDKYYTQSADKEPKERTGTTNPYVNYRGERNVISIKDNIFSCTDEQQKRSGRPPCMLKTFDGWDIMNKLREITRFGGNGDISTYRWNKRDYEITKEEKDRNSKFMNKPRLIYYAGTVELPLDVYIHPGDALIVLVKGIYYPMLVGKVEAGSDGRMKITSPPLERYKTDEEYEKEYPNTLFDNFDGSEQDDPEDETSPIISTAKATGPDGKTYKVINYDKNKPIYWRELLDGGYEATQTLSLEDERHLVVTTIKGSGTFYIIEFYAK